MLWCSASAVPLPGALGYRLLLAGEGEYGTDWSTKGVSPYRSACHSIQVVLAGSGAIQIDGTWHPLRSGETVVVPGHRWLRRRGRVGLRLRFANFTVEPTRVDFDLGACPGLVVAGPADAAVLSGCLLAALRGGPSTPAAGARVVAGLAVACALLAEGAAGCLAPLGVTSGRAGARRPRPLPGQSSGRYR